YSLTTSSFIGKNGPNHNKLSKYGWGLLNSTSSVSSSTAVTPNLSASPAISLSGSNISLAFFIPAASNKNEYSPLVFGESALFQENSKSCAVTGSPFDHSASSRILKVHDF